MDLAAYILMNDEELEAYVNDHYGEPSRFRGVRFMRVETVPMEVDGSLPETSNERIQAEMFNRHLGKDVVYVHTRCGAYYDEDNPDSNYRYFEADKWEQSNPCFIESCDDAFDGTYRDHYFKAVNDDSYRHIIEGFEGDGPSGDD